jgi:phytoene dehydrogenase-like protein
MRDTRAAGRIAAKAADVADKRGGDSVFTLYLSLDLDREYFATIASAHFFYTPLETGLSSIDLHELADQAAAAGGGFGDGMRFTADKDTLFSWASRYLELTTYEISCPVLRDPSLAPEGKTGLIVSTLMEYSLFRHIRDLGWYEEFRKHCAKRIVTALDASIFPGFAAAIIDSFTSTPLTLEKRSGNSDGAITGWAFTNDSMPAVHSLPRVARSILTPIPDVYQAGQWSYSPSGLPISILTGKLAADRIARDLGG